MRTTTYFSVAVLLVASLTLAAPKEKTFLGNISDDMCGLKHEMAGKTSAECTLECVKMGGKYVLADTVNRKVYKLSDQERPQQFAGQKVKVTGTLQGDTIHVASIVAAE
ncbi:MAG: hypothetical protein LAN62_12690 [Acidobacteriia bacterium]|nr:hypothetical protein [Terriglobia bacterium]